MPATATRPQFIRAYTGAEDLMADPPGTRIHFTASTSGQKRDGLNLRSDGWLVANYRSSGGPILWNHDHNRPAIGTGDPSVGDRLRIGVVFDQEDEFARQIESKVRRKFLRAGSVGWDFTDRDGRLITGHWRMSPDYLAREAFYDLSEYSIVNVPADPTALAERHRRAMRSLGQELVDLYDDQERTDSDALEHQVRAAVLDECRRLGVPLFGDDGDITTYVRHLRAVGAALLDAESDPDSPGGPSTNNEAARAVLAAFPTLKGAS